MGNSSEDGPCDSAKVVLRQVAALKSGLEQLAGTMDWVRRKETGKDFTPSWPHPKWGTNGSSPLTDPSVPTPETPQNQTETHRVKLSVPPP